MEIFKGTTKKEVNKLEKDAELAGKLNHDTEEIKYENDLISNPPVEEQWKKSEPSKEDIESAEIIQEVGRKELFENKKSKEKKLDLLKKKFARQIVEFQQLPFLSEEIEEIEEKQKSIEVIQQDLRMERDIIEQISSHGEWQLLLSEAEVIDAIHSNMNHQELENFKQFEKRDKILKIISLGLIKPKGVEKFLDWKAKIMLFDKVKNINKKLSPLKKELIKLEIEKFKKRKEYNEIWAFSDSPDWEEFLSIKSLIDSINQNIKQMEEVQEREKLN